MKKLFLTLCVFGLMVAAYSQINYTENYVKENPLPLEMKQSEDLIGDFTITDSDGNTWNLYEQLDMEKTVILDIFKTN